MVLHIWFVLWSRTVPEAHSRKTVLLVKGARRGVFLKRRQAQALGGVFAGLQHHVGISQKLRSLSHPLQRWQ
jgi:hypothetical protein